MVNKKLQVWLPLLFALIMVVGMVFGYKLGNKHSSYKTFFGGNRTSSLEEALYMIRNHYVDSVQLDSLQGKAIQEMMTELDPHSVYLPPVDLKEANEDLAGNFEGIGVEFNVFADTVNVVYVIPGGPSDKAGIRIGDKILAVNNHPLTGRPFSSDEIKSFIRGEGGSQASLLLLRDGKQLTVPVTRGTIPISSIDAAYMLDATTGYIKLAKFTDNSYEEFMAALETLQKEGLKNLVYDLRGNGGGFMNEAVEMADEFLSGDKLVVYTQGVNSSKKEYRCRRKGLLEEGKVVLIVDELSASASEVLAGALQDWCRATIVGRRTFGKGLVQEQYSLSDGSAIRLTTARYYTPLGRSIQRSYEKGKKVYMDELWNRFNSGEMLSADSLKSHNGGKQFTNSCHDTLYGGDGITPNIFVPFDTSHTLQKIIRMINNNELNSLVYNYYLLNKAQVDKYKTAAEYTAGFNSNDLWTMLISKTNDSFRLKSISSAERNMIQDRLKALLARYRWRNTGFYQVINNYDTGVKKATEIINAK